MSALLAPSFDLDPLSRLLAQVGRGEDALVLAEGIDALDLIDAAAALLENETCRVVRVRAAQPGLSLSVLMAQIAGATDLADQDDAVVKLGYQRLAVPDVEDGRVVLLVSGAEWLQRPALRFIQHVGRSARALVLVLAGGPGLLPMLDGDDFAPLRTRLTAAPPIERAEAPLLAAPIIVTMPSIALPPLPSPPSRRRGFVWPAMAGVAASIAFGVLIGRTLTPAPQDPAAAGSQALASAQPSAPVAIGPSSPAEPGGGAPPSAPARDAAMPSPAAAPAVAPPAPQIVATLEPMVPVAAPSAEPQAPRAADDTLRTRPPLKPRPTEARQKEPQKELPKEPVPPHRREVVRVNQKVADDEPDRTPSRPAARWRPPPAWDTGLGIAAASPAASGPFIGTSTVDRNGVRTFHFGP
ncbi:MAG: hypothetical protein NVSMB18_18520 [Acetobacteraceae bacterium]